MLPKKSLSDPVQKERKCKAQHFYTCQQTEGNDIKITPEIIITDDQSAPVYLEWSILNSF